MSTDSNPARSDSPAQGVTAPQCEVRSPLPPLEPAPVEAVVDHFGASLDKASRCVSGATMNPPVGPPLPDLNQLESTASSSQSDYETVERALTQIDQRLAEAIGPAPDSANSVQQNVPQDRPPGQASSASERRAYPRRESGCVVSVFQPEAGSAVSEQRLDWALHSSTLRGQLVDISMNGIAFVLPQPIDAQAHLYLRLANRRLDLQHDVAAHVIRSVEEPDGEWKVVCRLERKLSYELVSAFGKNLFQSTYV